MHRHRVRLTVLAILPLTQLALKLADLTDVQQMMIAGTNHGNGASAATASGTQITGGSALIACLAGPVDAFQGHAVLLSNNDQDPTPTPGSAWTLVGTRATAPPALHQCCRPARAHGPRPQHDHDHASSGSDTEDESDTDDDGWTAPRFYDLVLSDARSRTCRVQNVVKRAGDNLHLESDYPDLVSAGAHLPSPARATDAGPKAGYFTFTTTTLYAGVEETRPFLELYFPRLLALVRDAGNAPDVIVCRGELVTDAPAVLAAYYGDAVVP
ncbi:hypothetical protein GGF31_004614 [Allomyces arbusculus]|nr:hypothetical protein GGF31_004614 [Allomyces arbusculus]